MENHNHDIFTTIGKDGIDGIYEQADEPNRSSMAITRLGLNERLDCKIFDFY